MYAVCMCIHFCSDLRYKEEIMQYLERDKAVKQERAQLELDHQMRLEEVERNICQQNETFIKELSSAKEKVPPTAAVLFIKLNFQLHSQSPTDSSVGRAVDCRGDGNP